MSRNEQVAADLEKMTHCAGASGVSGHFFTLCDDQRGENNGEIVL